MLTSKCENGFVEFESITVFLVELNWFHKFGGGFVNSPGFNLDAVQVVVSMTMEVIPDQKEEER